MDVYVSMPPQADARAAEAARIWEQAIRGRLPAGRSVIAIADLVDGELRLRSADMMAAEVGDFTEPTKEILANAGVGT